MSDASRSDVFTMIREDPERVLAELAETLGAVVGETCRLEIADSPDGLPAFSDAPSWTIPWSGPGDDGARGIVVLDAAAVTRAAGALAMMPAADLAAAAASGEVPDKIVSSLPGLGNLLVGALAKLCGGAELRPGTAAETAAGPWPDVLSGAGPGAVHLAARLTVGEEEAAGHVLVAAPPAAGAGAPDQRPADAARVTRLDGMTVRMIGRPGDPAQVALGDVVEALGGRVLPMHQTSLLADPPAAAFVVSRSPSDLRARMETLAADEERPPLIVACSDRPTRDLVLSARQAGADDFLVLPTTRERLVAVLAKALQPA